MITFEKFQLNNYADCFVVTDKKIAELFDIVGDNVFLLPRGEKAKTFFWARRICERLLSKAARKDSLVVAVGGGSVGDTVGFAASIYKRGIKLLQVPTTFLAQIDSGIGGKTALDLNGVKNAVGTFYAADTLIDIDFLKTLPPKQRRDGLGELLKYRMLSDEVDSAAQSGEVSKIVRACATFKQNICDIDPTDKNQRRVLNFGHTVGHALELSQKLSHGEAVANGIYYETAIAEKLGLVDKPYAEKWQHEVKKIFRVRALTEDILRLTLQDKKNQSEGICFVLPSDDEFHTEYLPFLQVKNILLS